MEHHEMLALLGSVKSLTKLGTTPDGGIIVGPQGWAEVQLQLFEHFTCGCCGHRVSRDGHLHIGCRGCTANTARLEEIANEIQRST